MSVAGDVDVGVILGAVDWVALDAASAGDGGAPPAGALVVVSLALPVGVLVLVVGGAPLGRVPSMPLVRPKSLIVSSAARVTCL